MELFSEVFEGFVTDTETDREKLLDERLNDLWSNTSPVIPFNYRTLGNKNYKIRDIWYSLYWRKNTHNSIKIPELHESIIFEDIDLGDSDFMTAECLEKTNSKIEKTHSVTKNLKSKIKCIAVL